MVIRFVKGRTAGASGALPTGPPLEALERTDGFLRQVSAALPDGFHRLKKLAGAWAGRNTGEFTLPGVTFNQ